MIIEELRSSGCIIFESISGSRAYGLATAASDWDIRGVFVLPQDLFYSFQYVEQVSDERNNVIFYELRKFLDLLAKNNPNVLELLNMPEECVKFEHPLYTRLKSEKFVSKLCKETFAQYAISQLKKAWGLNKKVMNPIDERRKSLLEFCYVVEGQGSIPLMEFLARTGLVQESLGLVAIAHMSNLYAVFHSDQRLYNGIVRNTSSMDVTLSSVPKGEKPIAILSFNKDGYSTYQKHYHEYWAWVSKRNEDRFQNTISHGKNYDAKNMMHVFRLLGMAGDIGHSGQITVRQTDREFLLKIKNGDFHYDELVRLAEQKMREVEEIYKASSLQERPDITAINQLLVRTRKDFYGEYTG